MDLETEIIENYRDTAADIREAVADLERLVTKAEQALATARQQPAGQDQDFYLDSAALNIDNFYEKLEQLFQQIALTIDNDRPTGPEWLHSLLYQMQTELPGVRPAVLSAATGRALAEFWQHRPEVRQIIHGFHFDLELEAQLVQVMAAALAQSQPELLAFAGYLEAVSGKS